MTSTQITYFDRFRNNLVFQLGSQHFDEFWCRSVLRESFHDEGVRQIVLGLGALSHALEGVTHDVPLHENTFLTITNNHYTQAMKLYAQSLNRFRTQLATSGTRAVKRNVLISSILFSAFEVLHGNSATSDSLMIHGVGLLKDELLKSTLSLQQSMVAASIDDEGIEDAEFLLMRRLTLRALLSSQKLQQQVSDIISGCCFSLRSVTVVPAQGQPFQILWKLWMRFFTLALMWSVKIEVLMNVNGQLLIPSQHLIDDQDSMLEQIDAWARIAEAKSATETNESARQVLRKLLTGSKGLRIYIETTLGDRDSMSTDQIAAVKEIFDLAESILAETPIFQQGLGEVYDGIQCMTFGLAMKLRNQYLRTRAVRLARKMVKSQSRWDFKEIYMVFCTLVDIEEKERNEDGTIPFERRYIWKYSTWRQNYTLLDVCFEKPKSMEGVCNEKRMLLRPTNFGFN